MRWTRACLLSAILAATVDVRAESLKPLADFERSATIDELERVIGEYQTGLARAQKELGQLRTSADTSARGDEGTPRIVNGVLTAGFPTTGALLKGHDAASAQAWCSGTLIGCNTFLTAAHCVADDRRASRYKVFLQHAGVFDVESVSFHENYDFPNADVAVLKLKRPVSGITPTPINQNHGVRTRTPATIVGFGRTGGFFQNYGLKRVGFVQTTQCRDGLSNTNLICWNFSAPVGLPGEDSNTCNGDSGGPLFAQFTAGEQPLVAGITSGGRSRTCLSEDHAYDTNVFQYRSWIRQATGDDLATRACGALPQIGQEGVMVVAGRGRLGNGSHRELYEMDVRPGTTVLRIAMNAEDDGRRSNDFNLYVKAGSAPTISDFDCRQNGNGQFAFCEFLNPKAGTWYVSVDRAAGEGEYQIVATMFE